MTTTTTKRFALVTENGFAYAMRVSDMREWNRLTPRERALRRRDAAGRVLDLLAVRNVDAAEVSAEIARDLRGDGSEDEMEVNGGGAAGACTLLRIA